MFISRFNHLLTLQIGSIVKIGTAGIWLDVSGIVLHIPARSSMRFKDQRLRYEAEGNIVSWPMTVLEPGRAIALMILIAGGSTATMGQRLQQPPSTSLMAKLMESSVYWDILPRQTRIVHDFSPVGQPVEINRSHRANGLILHKPNILCRNLLAIEKVLDTGTSSTTVTMNY